MRRILIALIGLIAAAGSVSAQSWSTAYEAGLAAARTGDWAAARDKFKQAAAYRTEDVSGITLLPGPATEKKRWRDGAAYSPNFLAAYSSYRLANETHDPSVRTAQLRTAAQELNTLLAKKQVSYEAIYYLNSAYVQLGDTQKQRELEATMSARTAPINWRVDTEVLAPEELAQIASVSGREQAVPIVTPEVAAGGASPAPSTGGAPPAVLTTPGVALGVRVPVIATKYALVIGNSESRIAGSAIPFAADDAQLIREALIYRAGYPEENVDVVANATGAAIAAAAKALSERVPDGATIFIFFAGTGVNVDGRDYLAGVDADSMTATAAMVPKSELYGLFMAKGARIFSFFEANRPIVAGRYFGQEVPMFGMISQAQATIPGQQIYGIVRNGKTVGSYADAMSGVLADFRTNRVPILEFGWQVYFRIRRGDTGTGTGSSSQTPTLPVITNMASDARF